MFRSNENSIRPRKSMNLSSDLANKAKKGHVFQIEHTSLNEHPGNLSYNHYYNNKPSLPKHEPPPIDVKKSIMHQLEKYCENTTLHGLRYVGDPQLTFGERIFWLVSFTFAIGFAAYYISNIYAKWQSSPVIISFSPFDAELSSIPFPAITICNMNQAKKNEAEKILKEGSQVEKKLLDDSCNGNATFNDDENISWEALRDFLVKVGNSCSDILKSCQWGSDKINCEEHFNNDLTDEGLCCSFNRLPPEKIFRNMKDISILNQTYPSNVYDWNAEKGFEDIGYGDYIPRRPLGAGAHLGLSVILDAQISNYYCSSTRSTGFKVILSNPIETPKMADFGFLVSPGYETRVSIEPNIREATGSLRGVPIEKRQCYFSNERPLQYYRQYTKKSCSQECYAQNALSLCGCTPYYLPSTNDLNNGSQKIQMCEFYSKCVLRSKAKVDYHEWNEEKNGEIDKCNCLKACSEVSYRFQRSFGPIGNFTGKRIKRYYSLKYVKENVAKVTFFFDQYSYTKIVKMPIYAFTDLAASTGGLLGFFTGFSFLSGVEFVVLVLWAIGKEVYKRNKQRVIRKLTRFRTPLYPYVD